jgi:hypothetical protein
MRCVVRDIDIESKLLLRVRMHEMMFIPLLFCIDMEVEIGFLLRYWG